MSTQDEWKHLLRTLEDLAQMRERRAAPSQQPSGPPPGRIMQARRSGRCVRCGGVINVGQVAWCTSPNDPKAHAVCPGGDG